MIPSWMVIGGVAILVAFIGSSLTPKYSQWFRRLQRPRWLTFERAIPFIWIFIFVCGAASAYLVWEQDPGSSRNWLLMGFYLLLEVITVSYTPVMLQRRSLRAGTIIGGTGAVLGIFLAIAVSFISWGAFVLLLPYVFWSPIGTYTTWAISRLNPDD
ncbi:MAG: TspO protein [Cyanobacteria bacterium QH_8_48_120]|jgi:tryptophan-rich sensory protein|nr:MAG: TspO protein [Cyanobacteria bacterium QH_1_48_107]PSO57677.1 MAG: TspO protein [Cyanobacteria bacterium QH_7_48_89]PSO61222.1 MAG: TspO protein [Cyanobacteria bacterium QH_10_48_56]PSO69766.1 MAG: TspO protein [Cyanobacteria bacterium QS_1_48_34]PSO77004.1 MAG: TspO protein [Cyanobacteria bacterium QH_8_48_120]PSO77661.1 MAG: TspO protein [Cyanobacteria bacterium QH_3_48_40]PSO82209.1 MAG: TspO protein [Cyanobacteria bacterium QS_4_48_99]PSO83045.1 MAG: TspO protein [Cyanobacteria ba